MTIHKRLAEIQQKLKAPKNQKNNFGNYNYRSCEDIVEAVKPLLGELSLVISDSIELIGDRYYVKATGKLSDGENTIEASAYARESANKKGMDDAQLTGSCSSYARKYMLNGMFAIDDTKDADFSAPEKPYVCPKSWGKMAGLTLRQLGPDTVKEIVKRLNAKASLTDEDREFLKQSERFTPLQASK